MRGSPQLVLRPGELHHRRRFGPGTVNRGALLLDCEWDGGVVEAGALVSGVFHGGEHRGGTFLGGVFRGGEWTGGTWERGFDGRGRYRPAGDAPPHGEPAPRRLPPSPPRTDGGPELTVFTSTVYADVARLWLACVRRAFPGAAVEVFWDSDRPPPPPESLPGAVLLRRGPGRRDYHEAYDDAVARCSTRWLAITDTDVFWTSTELWPRLRQELAENTKLAAVSCISRRHRPSHGTFAVLLEPEVYRRALAGLPGGFAPAVEGIDPGVPWQRWTFHSSGDLITQAVQEAGYEVRLLHLDEPAAPDTPLVRFDGVTAPRRVAEHAPLPRLLAAGRYHWAGLLGNRILAGLHRRLFPGGPAYGLQVPAAALAWEALRRGPRGAADRLRLLARCRSAARRIESFLQEAQEVAP